MLFGRAGGDHHTARTNEMNPNSEQVTDVTGAASDHRIEPPGELSYNPLKSLPDDPGFRQR